MSYFPSFEEINSPDYDEVFNNVQKLELIEEKLIEKLLDFKDEVFNFIGTKEEYLNDINKENDPNRIQHVLSTVNNINNNLNYGVGYRDKNQKINFFVSGINIQSQNNQTNKIKYNPHFILTIKNLSIEYKSGFFFDKYNIYDSISDYFTLKPKFKTNKKIKVDEIENIINVLDSVIAELAQHPYKNINNTVNEKYIQKNNLFN